MVRSAIIYLLVCCRCLVFAQQIQYSKPFQTIRKNVPLALLNNHPTYFYLLRYNKLAHDMIIEKRSKPEAKMLAFKPLKLDSVNASWFDYEKLAYLFFERDNCVYFVFEKVLNTRKWIYMKTIDSTGRSSGFIELAYVEKEKNEWSVDLSFQLTAQKKILILVNSHYPNFLTRKTAILYDLQRREKLWERRLPLENHQTGYSAAFETDADNQLYYLMVKSRIVGYNYVYRHQRHEPTPVFAFDTLVVNTMRNDTLPPVAKRLDVVGLTALHSTKITTTDSTCVTVSVHCSLNDDEGKEKVFFLNQKFSPHLDSVYHAFVSPLKEEVSSRLVFFDGSEDDQPAGKNYTSAGAHIMGNHLFQLSERRNEGFFKELLLWRSELSSGIVNAQHIVPRKLFYFKYQTYFKNIGEAAFQQCGGDFYTFVLEHPANAGTAESEFRYHRFARQNALRGANLVTYVLRASDRFEKNILLQNGQYECIPIIYQSDQCDHVIYQLRGKLERFAFVPLNQL